MFLASVTTAKPLINIVEDTDETNIINVDIFEDITNIPFLNDRFSVLQQLGVRCIARPFCPDCGNRVNVCSGAEEFYGGVTAVVGKRDIIAKCKRANALDNCGGSRGCMKKTRQEQENHRNQYGGGCYKSCEKAAVCYVDSR